METFVLSITAGILFITAGIAAWYAWETRKLRQEVAEQTKKLQQANAEAAIQTVKLHQANTFAALSQVHKTLSNERSYRMREYLHTGFAHDLGRVAQDVLGDKYVGESGGVHVKIGAVLSELKENVSKIREFNDRLRNEGASRPLEAVEQVLLDFDIVAIPLIMDIESAKEIAQAYRPIFERTAPAILPFVAIQMRLRGNSDRRYKEHYRKLLQKMGIDLQGIEVPTDP
ncbi:MAG: hypothetical protein HY671_04015 [Chloroflexi bacterium]|nr:hypothetical protein [Chloroflexota bacterium]